MEEDFYGLLPLTEKQVPDLVRLIDTVLIRDDSTREKTSHYPSGARVVQRDGRVLGKCIRQQYYDWTLSEPGNFDVSSLWKMDMGNAIHEWIGDKLDEEFKVVREYTVQYSPDFLKNPIRGRIDNLVVPSDRKAFGVEIKSGYGRGITNRKDGIKYAGPKDSHLLQALIYLYISRLPQEEKALYMPIDEQSNRPFECPELDFMVLYYLARDNAYRCTYYVDLINGEELCSKVGEMLSDERKEVIRGRDFVPIATDGKNVFIYEDISFREIVHSFMLVEKYIELKQLPARDYHLEFTLEDNKMLIVNSESDWQCKYCNYARRCWLWSEGINEPVVEDDVEDDGDILSD